MVSHCANPACSTPLRYLRDGRLFQFEIKSLIVPGFRELRDQSQASKQARQVSHFWLCGRCASTMTLRFDGLRGIRILPLEISKTQSGSYPWAMESPHLSQPVGRSQPGA